MTGETGIRLGRNRFGKAEVRLVKIGKDTPRHVIEDLSVTSQLHGDFAAAHLVGDNTGVVATDSQKNAMYVLARELGIGSPETFLLALAEHFVSSYEQVSGGRWTAESYDWARIQVDGEGSDHAFVRQGQETRTSVVHRAGDRTWVISGLTDLVVLKSAGSEFSGFPRDRFTTLADTTDRILATSVSARWLFDVPDPAAIDFTKTYDRVKELLLTTFATTHSLALQQSMFAMGKRVLAEIGEIAEIRFSMPNKHHFLVDLAPFGVDNPNEIFYAADRPYGLIEAAVLRDGAPDDSPAWDSVGTFC